MLTEVLWPPGADDSESETAQGAEDGGQGALNGDVVTALKDLEKTLIDVHRAVAAMGGKVDQLVGAVGNVGVSLSKQIPELASARGELRDTRSAIEKLKMDTLKLASVGVVAALVGELKAFRVRAEQGSEQLLQVASDEATMVKRVNDLVVMLGGESEQ